MNSPLDAFLFGAYTMAGIWVLSSFVNAFLGLSMYASIIWVSISIATLELAIHEPWHDTKSGPPLEEELVEDGDAA